MAMASSHKIFVPGSKFFDIPQFKALHKTVKKDLCIQSEPFTVGGYDWVIKFYPNGTSSQDNTDNHSQIFIKVLKAEEKCSVISVICTPFQWDWNTSTWNRRDPKTMDLQPSGDTSRSAGFDYPTKPFPKVSKFCMAGSKFLKDDMIRMKFDLLVTPNPTPPAPSPKPTCGCLSNLDS